MTSELRQAQAQKTRHSGGAAIFRARCVLLWEQLYPALLPALGVAIAYSLTSLFGAWAVIPSWLHWGFMVGAFVAFSALLFLECRKITLPTRRDAQVRLEQDGKVEHAALQALDDQPTSGGDPASPLWQAHMAEMRVRARKARLKGIRQTAQTTDPWGLRFTGLGLLVIALIASGDKTTERLLAGLQPGSAGGGTQIADLWIEPPAYAGKAPIYLLRAGEDIPEDPSQVDAPEGSVVVAQINGRGRTSLSLRTETDVKKAVFSRTGQAARTELSINESGLLLLSMNGRQAQWPIGIISDNKPSVMFVTTPGRTDDARLEFSVAIEDDYGVVSAELMMQLDPEQERPLDAPALGDTALAETRRIKLDGITGPNGERTATLDLQADPWAGLHVLTKVIVTDGAGQTGETSTTTAKLPARIFYNPVAKAVIEQRQSLAIAEKEWSRVARSFDAITLAPSIFYEDKPKNYLLLRTAFWRVMRQNGDTYSDAIEKFWPLALQLEDEALELARQRLEAAQEALRQALERGASEEEINRLVEELRQAMNDYLTALAQSGQPSEGGQSQNAQQLDQSDLDQMLDEIRNLSQQGADNAARQMLSDLQNLLNNLRLSQSGQGSGQSSGQGGEGQGQGGAAGMAGDLIGRQRELADETFERGRNPESSGDDLAAREGGLGGDLDELMDALGSDPNLDPNGDAGRALGRARSAMREAEGALGAEQFGMAADAMERAIDNLRSGAEALAREQMRQAAEQGGGEEGQGQTATDPLGRPFGEAVGEGVEVPGLSEAGRTREVIEELRKRLGEPGREEEEKSYLERLLERF